jgi:hypothetical protein
MRQSVFARAIAMQIIVSIDGGIVLFSGVQGDDLKGSEVRRHTQHEIFEIGTAVFAHV